MKKLIAAIAIAFALASPTLVLAHDHGGGHGGGGHGGMGGHEHGEHGFHGDHDFHGGHEHGHWDHRRGWEHGWGAPGWWGPGWFLLDPVVLIDYPWVVECPIVIREGRRYYRCL